jgi:hypothetical protein
MRFVPPHCMRSYLPFLLLQIATVVAPPRPSSIVLDPSLGQKAEIVRSFLNSTQSQLSMEGLFHLHSVLKEGELAILFRNNHFSTITIGPGGTLYSLVTDIGFLHDSARVWETISLTGDVVMVRVGSESIKQIKSISNKRNHDWTRWTISFVSALLRQITADLRALRCFPKTRTMMSCE